MAGDMNKNICVPNYSTKSTSKYYLHIWISHFIESSKYLCSCMYAYCFEIAF